MGGVATVRGFFLVKMQIDKKIVAHAIFRAYKLLKVCRDIFDQVDDVLQTPIYSDPLTPDNYEV